MASSNRPDLNAVERLASKFVEKHCLAPPVRIEELLGLYATVENDALPGGWDALLYEKNGQVHVVLSSKVASKRRRFTCGHEIGHTIIWWHARELIVCGSGRDNTSRVWAQEREADHFSACVLVPQNWLSANVGENAELDVARITSDCDVSLEVAARAYCSRSGRSVAVWVLDRLTGKRRHVSEGVHVALNTQDPAAQQSSFERAGATYFEMASGSCEVVLAVFPEAPPGIPTDKSSKEILAEILNSVELSAEDRHRFNGIIGAALSHPAMSSIEQTRKQLWHRLVLRSPSAIDEITRHRNFASFLSAKAAELQMRSKGRQP
jgi:hypothetical protein